MVPFLNIDTPFPSVSTALNEPNGLLATGADLKTSRLVNAYSEGIFPWYSEGDPILWWSPNPRMVFDIQKFRPSRSLCRMVKKDTSLRATVNQDFEKVIDECARSTENRPSTWIVNDIKQAYLKLHQQGHAHSLEIWQKDQLVGGIYGVTSGNVFCGESMFSRISNGSKIALACLVGYLRHYDFSLIDAQIENPHLISLGAFKMGRNTYINRLKAPITAARENMWDTKLLDLTQFISRNP